MVPGCCSDVKQSELLVSQVKQDRCLMSHLLAISKKKKPDGDFSSSEKSDRDGFSLC